MRAQVNHCAAEHWLPLPRGLFKVHRRALKCAAETDVERDIAEILMNCNRGQYARAMQLLTIELEVFAELIFNHEGVVLIQLTALHLREQCGGERTNVAHHQEVHHVSEGLGHVVEYQAVVVH